MIRFFIYCAIFLSFHFLEVESNQVLGCGGYIRSEVEINFSQVHLKLFTRQKNLKYETECAPNNGYYFIPLYDLGHYILKVSPPVGWSFEPSEIELIVDGETDPCSKNEDINFVFKGFAVIGRVISSGSDVGPSGVSVTLNKGQKEVSKTVTDTKGDFLFTPLGVGTYEVIASHSSWKLLKNKVTVDIVDKNGDAGRELVIAGYSLKGNIANVDKSLVPYLKIVLHSPLKQIKHEIGCSKDKLNRYTSKLKHPVLCHVAINSKGDFNFAHLPLGKYVVVPWIDHSDISFIVEPSLAHLQVDHNDMVIKEPFRIMGRDIRGKVLIEGSEDRGGALAQVALRDDLVTQTDAKGLFAFKEVPFGRYWVKISLDGYEFEDVALIVGADTPDMVSISPSKYEVCFTVSVDSASDINIPWTISIIGKDSEDSVQTGSTGTSCIKLKPGTYKASVILTPQDQEAGIRFGPEEISFTVTSTPIKNLSFVQFLAEIQGVINCLESCKSLIITLRPVKGESGSSRVTTSNQEKFVFKDVVPGEYFLSVDKEEWCWKNQTLQISVNKKMIATKFVQTGFRLTLHSSHKTSLSYLTNQKHRGKLMVSEGTSRECVSAPGKYTFTSTGCHVYSGSNLAWDTSSPQLLSLIPSHHKVSGRVVSNEQGPFTIIVKSDRKSENVLGPLKPIDKENYGFETLMEVGETATFVPTSSSNLFQYTPTEFTIESINDCQLDAVEFIAERALFFKGYVNPPIKGVSINVSAEEKVQVFTTNADGFFIAGPLNKSMNYTVSAEKFGYIITPPLHKVDVGRQNTAEIVKLNFEVYKLAEIIVTVLDDSSKPLEGVLVSTSGGKDYRQNSLTEENGVFAFRSLMPSDYFIRPMMKEYVFEPASKIVNVEAGATVNVEIRGKRIAYSIWGQTVSLSGEVEGDVVMEAVGVGRECDGLQEEALSDAQGYFRIRGLIPKCDYKLRLKEGKGFNDHVERSLPKEISVQLQTDDQTDVKVVVLRPFLQMDVAVIVETDPKFLTSLSAELYRDDSLESPIQVIPLKNHPFFMLPPMIMDKKTYTVRLGSSLSRQLYTYASPSTSFVANQSFVRRNLAFHPVLKHVEAEISRSTVFFLIFSFLMVFVVLNHAKLQPVFVQLVDYASSVVSKRKISKSFPVQSSSQPSFVDTATARKRTKSKKI